MQGPDLKRKRKALRVTAAALGRAMTPPVVGERVFQLEALAEVNDEQSERYLTALDSFKFKEAA